LTVKPIMAEEFQYKIHLTNPTICELIDTKPVSARSTQCGHWLLHPWPWRQF